MTKKEYKVWRKEFYNKDRRIPFLFEGITDKIIILGTPTDIIDNGYIEGAVIESESKKYPIGYYSYAWMCENFNFSEMSLNDKTKKEESEKIDEDYKKDLLRNNLLHQAQIISNHYLTNYRFAEDIKNILDIMEFYPTKEFSFYLKHCINNIKESHKKDFGIKLDWKNNKICHDKS